MLVWVRRGHVAQRSWSATEISISTRAPVDRARAGPRPRAPASARPLQKKRSMIAKPAALGATDRNAVTGVGAPW